MRKQNQQLLAAVLWAARITTTNCRGKQKGMPTLKKSTPVEVPQVDDDNERMQAHAGDGSNWLGFHSLTHRARTN